jgi:hypothetical protein
VASLRDVSLAEAGKYGSLNDYAFFDKVRIKDVIFLLVNLGVVLCCSVGITAENLGRNLSFHSSVHVGEILYSGFSVHQWNKFHLLLLVSRIAYVGGGETYDSHQS